jgi:hypothetical protein
VLKARFDAVWKQKSLNISAVFLLLSSYSTVVFGLIFEG